MVEKISHTPRRTSSRFSRSSNGSRGSKSSKTSSRMNSKEDTSDIQKLAAAALVETRAPRSNSSTNNSNSTSSLIGSVNRELGDGIRITGNGDEAEEDSVGSNGAILCDNRHTQPPPPPPLPRDSNSLNLISQEITDTTKKVLANHKLSASERRRLLLEVKRALKEGDDETLNSGDGTTLLSGYTNDNTYTTYNDGSLDGTMYTTDDTYKTYFTNYTKEVDTNSITYADDEDSVVEFGNNCCRWMCCAEAITGNDDEEEEQEIDWNTSSKSAGVSLSGVSRITEATFQSKKGHNRNDSLSTKGGDRTYTEDRSVISKFSIFGKDQEITSSKKPKSTPLTVKQRLERSKERDEERSLENQQSEKASTSGDELSVGATTSATHCNVGEEASYHASLLGAAEVANESTALKDDLKKESSLDEEAIVVAEVKEGLRPPSCDPSTNTYATPVLSNVNGGRLPSKTLATQAATNNSAKDMIDSIQEEVDNSTKISTNSMSSTSSDKNVAIANINVVSDKSIVSQETGSKTTVAVATPTPTRGRSFLSKTNFFSKQRSALDNHSVSPSVQTQKMNNSTVGRGVTGVPVKTVDKPMKWKEWTDPASGKAYYSNSDGVTTWTKPADFVGKEERLAAKEAVKKSAINTSTSPLSKAAAAKKKKKAESPHWISKLIGFMMTKKKTPKSKKVMPSTKPSAAKPTPSSKASPTRTPLAKRSITATPASPARTVSSDSLPGGSPAKPRRVGNANEKEDGSSVDTDNITNDSDEVAVKVDTPTTTTTQETEPPKKKKWREYTDASTGKKYYSNGTVVTWDRPADFVERKKKNPASVNVYGDKRVTMISFS
jgi:hypothetical protein